MLSKKTLVNRCLRLRPEKEDLLGLATDPGRLLTAGVKGALRDLAHRWKRLDDEIKALNKQIEALVHAAAPELVELHGVGVEIAGQFLVTAGDNAERIRNEAAFAKLCGVAPQPASSGRPTGRHRLSRGGDRGANQRPLHRHHRPDASSPTNPPLRRTAHRRRPEQTRDHPLLEALHRPRNLRQPSPTIHGHAQPASDSGLYRSIERLNRTLQPNGLPEVLTSNTERTAALAPWLGYYNTQRRHSAFGGHPHPPAGYHQPDGQIHLGLFARVLRQCPDRLSVPGPWSSARCAVTRRGLAC
ncbi:transposase [Amycolatopsis sp. FDAARGOS 1241]|nr:transposase [Amycolatopsis sp. FDAARGOS 1241]